jgi:hypothetical protein
MSHPIDPKNHTTGVSMDWRSFGRADRYYTVSQAEAIRAAQRRPSPLERRFVEFLKRHEPELKMRVGRSFKQWNIILRGDLIQVPSRLSATEVLSRVQVLRDGYAQWDAVLSELNPTGDTDVQQLLIEIRGPNMFAPGLGLGVIEDGCKRALALSPNADALAALREAIRRQDPFVR